MSDLFYARSQMGASLAFHIVFYFSKRGASSMYGGLTNWWAPLLLGWTALTTFIATVSLWRRKFILARIAAVAEVPLILAGWGLAQYPNLLTPDLTVYNSSAALVTLRLLVLALGVRALVLFPSLFYLFYVFKRTHPQ